MGGHLENQQNCLDPEYLFIFLYYLLFLARGQLESKARKKQTNKKLIYILAYNISDKNYE